MSPVTPLAPGFSLGPYDIVELVGVGSMGEVYRARDHRLERDVAVKVLSAAAVSDPERFGRFEQEARVAGALSHPNIVAVHDVGEHEGIRFVVCELVDGATLREELGDGPLPVRRALDYAAQIARGLAAAHALGVVHRDLKPENVMITRDGRVKLVDFGIARLDVRQALVADPGAAATRPGTQPGLLVGTAAYMAPEQVRGEAVDHRADIFSLGVVLHEMVTGTGPFRGTSAGELFGAILRDDPDVPSSVPLDVARLIRHCLEKRREERFQSASDLAFALDAAGQALGAGSSRRAQALTVERESPGARERTVAVLPFGNLSRDPESEYFSDGLTEEITHELTRVPGLRVVAWTSSAKLRDREKDLQAIGEQLGVSTVLTGGLRKAGDRLRVTARLVDTRSGFYLWSESYDRRVEDIFAIQEEIAHAIAVRLAQPLQPRRAPGAARRPENAEAYGLYLKGRFFWNKRTGDGLLKSVECFDQAIAADPRLGVAYAGLADAYCLLADYGLMPPREAIAKARPAALAALELDPLSAEAHVSYALIRSIHDWEWDEGEAFYRRALELNPAYATAHHWFAIDFLGMRGRFEEAYKEIDIARELDPLSMIILEGRPYLLTLERRLDEALTAYYELVELDRTFYKAYTSLGRVLSLAGQHREAIEMLERGQSIAGEVPNILAALGQVHALAGDRDEARAYLDGLTRLATRRYVPSTSFALVHAGLGENDRALDWLERGCDQHELPLVAIGVHPLYDSLRDQPRFQRLVARMRLEG